MLSLDIYCFLFLFFFVLVVHVLSLHFWYCPFILLHFLVRAAHFAIFRVAVSQISRVSSTLRLFLSVLPLCFAILRFCGRSFPFNWLYLALISLHFVQVLCKLKWFNVFHLILRHFGFTLLVRCLIRDDKQSGKPDLQFPPGKMISALHFAQLFPRLFIMVTSFLNISTSFFKIGLP